MKLIDQKGKLFGIINAVDFFVVLLVIAVGLGTYYKFGVMDKTSSNTPMEPISYTVEIKGIRGFVFDNVKEGDEIFDKTSGNSIGKITKIESSPAKEALSFVDGKASYGTIQNRYDVVFYIDAQGVINDKGYYVNKNYELIVGSKKKFMTKYFEGEGSVKQIITEN